MRPRPGKSLCSWRWLLLALAAGLAACGGSAQDLPEPPPPMMQGIVFRVLDQKDRPLAGVSLDVTALQGRPQKPGPYVSDAQGLIQLPWLTFSLDQRAGHATKDQVFALAASLEYQLEAPGYLPEQGRLQTEGQYRQLARPELKGIDIPAVLNKRVLTVVLHRLEDLLGPGLDRRPTGDPLVKGCLDFYKRNRLVAKNLGAEFAWPAFLLQGDLLRVRLDWKGAAWSALSKVPLPAQVSLSTGLPLIILVGEDLLPAPGVGKVSLEVLSEIPPKEGDPHAPPVRARVAMAAPAAAMQDLAASRLEPDGFLFKYPPRLEQEGSLAVPPFGEAR
ncbi:Carboxypeptidase regulatory-like domain-containing protein [Desulfarculales bacterium]